MNLDVFSTFYIILSYPNMKMSIFSHENQALFVKEQN